MGQITEEMRKRRVTGIAGGGMVEIEVNGLMEALRCRIDPQLITQNDRELLEDLITAAVNQAIAKGKATGANEPAMNITISGRGNATRWPASCTPRSNQSRSGTGEPAPKANHTAIAETTPRAVVRPQRCHGVVRVTQRHRQFRRNSSGSNWQLAIGN